MKMDLKQSLYIMITFGKLPALFGWQVDTMDRYVIGIWPWLGCDMAQWT